MGVGFKRTLTTGDIPVFQGDGKDIQLAQGGFLLDITGLPASSVIKAGTPMSFDESTRIAKVIITGVVYENAGAAATSYKVEKGHSFKVGDNFGAVVGDDAYPITVIDTSNAAYDMITVGTTIGAVAAGALVFKSSATGANAAAFAFPPKGLLFAETTVESGESVSVVIRGTVYARRVPYSADLAAALPLIIYSQSF
ncbi:hypothetical protein EGT74_24510 [Chitinophaga lutea]|uniref:Uncharacterized protein n=1 Tax=Chitinophaga lutea TaxID=2488634 RepID=A0A3N4PGA4_9BACT|nr:hypothetical protein [Chitinophaga lutea]RPE05549.1 hypothetical protein EGT74_24510 [Chitinophaga lutea]